MWAPARNKFHGRNVKNRALFRHKSATLFEDEVSRPQNLWWHT